MDVLADEQMIAPMYILGFSISEKCHGTEAGSSEQYSWTGPLYGERAGSPGLFVWSWEQLSGSLGKNIEERACWLAGQPR